MGIFMLLIIFRICIPLFSRWIDGIPIFARPSDVIFFICSAFITKYVHTINIAFVNTGMMDFDRKLFFMKALSSVLMPRKDRKFIYSHMFPTMNIMDHNNLMAWLNLRTLMLDIG